MTLYRTFGGEVLRVERMSNGRLKGFPEASETRLSPGESTSPDLACQIYDDIEGEPTGLVLLSGTGQVAAAGSEVEIYWMLGTISSPVCCTKRATRRFLTAYKVDPSVIGRVNIRGFYDLVDPRRIW